MIVESKDIYDLVKFLKNQAKSEWAQEIDNLYARWKSAFERVEELDSELAMFKSKDEYKFYEESGYWKIENGKRVDGPFCPTCCDDKSKIMRLHKTAYPERHCQLCNNDFPISTLRGTVHHKGMK